MSISLGEFWLLRKGLAWFYSALQISAQHSALNVVGAQ